MKYRVLLTGNNKVAINAFFQGMEFSFDCLSTSNRHDDIVNHLKYVKPDIFVYCLLGETPDDIKKFVNPEHEISKRNIPIVLIGEQKETLQFLKIVHIANPMVFNKPFSFPSIERKIVELLDSKIDIQHDMIKPEQDVASNVTDAISSVEKMLAGLDIKVKEKEKEKDDRRKHILVIDDDSGVLKLVNGYLSGTYDVATAKSGKLALKFLETKSTDLILLDYEMPEENGASVFRKLRAMSNTKDIPVVFLTGIREKEKIQTVLSLHPRGYLLKPIDRIKLVTLLKKILA